MNAKQLKDSILKYAMQGKLVPQDPNDEHAEKILHGIYEERKYLTQEKIIKSNKAIEKINDDEIPYDIPESWKWVRLNDLAENCNVPFADGPFGSNLKREHYISEPEVRIIQLSNIGENGWKDQNVKFTSFQHLDSIKRSEVYPGDLVITKMMPAGRGIVVPNVNSKYVLSSDAVKFVPNKILNKEYLLYAINSNVFREQIYSEVQGITRVRTSLTKIKKYLLPIPPLNEQDRIVHKVKELFQKVEAFSTHQKDIEELQNKFPSKLENSILLYAMQGKLVEQDPNDEPAAELFKRIHEEKVRLLEEKVIKQEKALLPISDEEIPFDIPVNWTWVRLGEVINLVSGQDFPPDKYNHNGIGTPYITGASTLTKEGVLLNRWTETPQSIAESGDLLVVCKGSGYGKTLICNIEIAHIARQIMAIKKSDFINMEFIDFYLQSQLSLIKKLGQGVIPGIDRKSVLNLLLPLPPLNEQSRIVDKIKNTRDLINKFQLK